MITCDSDGAVIVKVDESKYKLSSSAGYADFLLWITTPDETVAIGKETFEVDAELGEAERDKALRYSEFLSDFAEKRELKLTEMSADAPFEQRQSEIKAFIEKLKDQGKMI